MVAPVCYLFSLTAFRQVFDHTVQDLESAVLQLQAFANDLQARIRLQKEYVERQKSELAKAPILRLPTEIPSYIMYLVVVGPLMDADRLCRFKIGNAKRAAGRLQLVCKSFSSVAKSTPALHSAIYIPLSPSLQKLTRELDQARAACLYILCHYRPDDNLEEIRGVLGTRRIRIARLDIEVEGYYGDGEIRPLRSEEDIPHPIFSSQALSQVSHLSIAGKGSSTFLSLPPAEGRSFLTHLDFEDDRLSRALPLFRKSLTHVRLSILQNTDSSFQIGDDPSYGGCLMAQPIVVVNQLALMEGLEVLDMEFSSICMPKVTPSFHGWDLKRPMFPALRHLTMKLHLSPESQFARDAMLTPLLSLKMPNTLESLNISIYGSDITHVTAFLDTLSTHGPYTALRKLTLKISFPLDVAADKYHIGPWVSAAFRKTPALQMLSIYDYEACMCLFCPVCSPHYGCDWRAPEVIELQEWYLSVEQVKDAVSGIVKYAPAKPFVLDISSCAWARDILKEAHGVNYPGVYWGPNVEGRPQVREIRFPREAEPSADPKPQIDDAGDLAVTLRV